MMKTATLYLLLAAVHIHFRTGSTITASYHVDNDNEMFRTLLLTETGSLVLGSDLALQRLNDQLVMQQIVPLPEDQTNRLLIGDPGGTYSGSFMSCMRMACELLDAEDITNQRWIGSNVLQDGTFVVSGLFVPGPGEDGESVFTALLRNDLEAMRASTIRRGSVEGFDDSDNQNYITHAFQIESSSFIPREFLTVFEHRGFSYYVNTMTIDDEESDDNIQIRVVRICNNDTSPPLSENSFASYFEMQLECGSSETAVPTAATFVSSDLTVVVTIATDTDNFMCVYELAEINRKMYQKFNSCRYGMGSTGLNRVMVYDCVEFDDIRLNNTNINECNLVSSLLPYQEVPIPFSVEPIVSLPIASQGQINSLVHSTLDNAQFLFAGTTNGNIMQYHYVDISEIRYIRSTPVINQSDVGVADITKMVATDDGLTLYALSPKVLVAQDIDVCDTYKSCDSCLGDGQDPICGWCVLENRCSRDSMCDGVWVSDNVGSCPRILSATPSIIYLRQLMMGDVEIQLTTDNIPNNGHDYQCWYGFPSSTSEQQMFTPDITMETMWSTATRDPQNEDIFTCPVPSNIPFNNIPNMEDALLSDLSLRYDGNDVAMLTTPLRFANCSVHTNCTSCIVSASECRWCPFTFKCISSTNELCSGVNEVAVASSCPQILPPADSFSNYLIHTNYMYEDNPLVIRAQNLNEFRDSFISGEFECIIQYNQEVIFRKDAVLNDDGTMVICQEQQYDYVNDYEVEIEAMLNVVWTKNQLNIDNPDNTKVILYSCATSGTNCAQCLALPADYQCNYCTVCQLEEIGCRGDDILITEVYNCDLPIIKSITPDCGPVEGGTMVTVDGTNLGTNSSQLTLININSVSCDLIHDTYQPGVSFQCVTNNFTSIETYPINVKLLYLPDAITGGSFTIKLPSLRLVSPTLGPQSGGTMVTITGNNLNIGSKLSVTIFGQDCNVTAYSEDEINCITSSSKTLGMGEVIVAIDNWSGVVNGVAYEYMSDPIVDTITPDFAFTSGGTKYTVIGQNLHIVQIPRLLVHTTTEPQEERRRRRQEDAVVVDDVIESQPCTSESDTGGTRLTCLAPHIITSPTTSQPITVVLGLMMDGVTSLLRIDNEITTVYPDPRFKQFKDKSFSSSEEIKLTIESQNSQFQFTTDQMIVLLSPCSREQCLCGQITFQSGNTSFECIVESTSGLSRGSDISVIAYIGNYNQTVGTIEIEEPLNIVIIIVPIVVLFIVALVVFAIILTIFCVKSRQKDSRYKELIVEMEKLESSVARECKLGFAELQTDLDELTGDVSGHRLPYRDLQVYLLATLFPGSKDHPILHPVQLPVHRQISTQRAIKDFHNLCMDKKVLLTFIRTLEEQRSFTIRDKSIVGSLLMVALHDRLDYATEVLKNLMSDQISRTVGKNSPKLLLRRTESVAEKMLTNWLAFCLHGYIVEQAGKPLYLLYKAVKSQLEKGPIDVITGEARYSLSEHKLIRQKMDVNILLVTVEADDGVKIPVKVLDCDTISQVKEKLLDTIYKATPVSGRPALTSIDLEYVTSPRDYRLLRDEDTSMVTEGTWKQLNTLKHYNIGEGATFRLMKRSTHAPPGQSYDYPASLISSHAVRNRALSEAEDGTRVWHLFKQHDVEDPRRSPFMNKKMITEVYLPRMLSTKNILQKFVDDLFSTLFGVSLSPTSPVSYSHFFPQTSGIQTPMSYAPGGTVPMAVKYLLDFLDNEATSAQITDLDVVHTWKNNALALRFWVNMMKNPEFVFDINKSHTVDACLSIIASAFIDGCSYADIKLTIDSPTNKLLYNKEVQGYKKKVRQYYQSVARLPHIPEDAMQSYLKQLSEYQSVALKKSGGFVVESTLYELLRYANKYSDQLLVNLKAAGLHQRAQVFESVVRATMAS